MSQVFPNVRSPHEIFMMNEDTSQHNRDVPIIRHNNLPRLERGTSCGFHSLTMPLPLQ